MRLREIPERVGAGQAGRPRPHRDSRPRVTRDHGDLKWQSSPSSRISRWRAHHPQPRRRAARTIRWLAPLAVFEPVPRPSALNRSSDRHRHRARPCRPAVRGYRGPRILEDALAANPPTPVSPRCSGTPTTSAPARRAIPPTSTGEQAYSKALERPGQRRGCDRAGDAARQRARLRRRTGARPAGPGPRAGSGCTLRRARRCPDRARPLPRRRGQPGPDAGAEAEPGARMHGPRISAS